MDVRINQRWSTALEVPVQGQSLAETDQSLVQSLVHENVNFGGTAGKEVVTCFNQNLQGSYWELFEWIGLLRIGPGAIWKMAIFPPETPDLSSLLGCRFWTRLLGSRKHVSRSQYVLIRKLWEIKVWFLYLKKSSKEMYRLYLYECTGRQGRHKEPPMECLLRF